MEAEQQASEKPTNQRINQKRNQNMHRNKWKWKHNNPKPLGFSVKAVLRGRFTAIHAHLKKQEKSQINNLTLHLKQVEKEEITNPRLSRRKEILKIRAEINAKETRETIAEINRTKSWSFEKIYKIDKPLARLIKKQREKNQINKIRNENGEITQTTQKYKGS